MIDTLSPRPLDYDICIVGAGPAGLTIASQLASSGLRICVLESGESSASTTADALKEVDFDGLSIKSNSRERIVGGTSATWDGRSAPLDEVDFEPRGWPAWPLSRDELLRYTAKTVQYRFPSPDDFEVDPPVASDRSSGPWQDLAVKLFVGVRPPYRFSALQSIFHGRDLDLWTGATVVQLKAGEGGRTVTAAVCRTPDGREAEVTARHFVLASGGIENARILLNSPADAGTLGNEHDQVGRCFMNHPKGYAGLLHLTRPLPPTSPLLDQASAAKVKYAGLRLAPAIQLSRGLLNSYVRFEPVPTNGGGLLARIDGLRERVHGSSRLWRVARMAGDRWASVGAPVRALRLRWYVEMEPRSTNRITLADRADALGVRRPHVHYELSERDRATIVALHEIVKGNVERLKLGRLESSADAVLGAATADASHHLGSTRMGDDPATSVVDRDCKVHAVRNLYVAGGSVFSSGGCANPTMTIVALALRLADRLRSQAVPRVTVVQRSRPEHAPTGIVLIGAGRRVSGDVVPSLASQDPRFEIVGIYARTTASVFGPGYKYDVQPMTAVANQAFDGARFIYVGVPRDAVVPVLKDLLRWADRELILDTPVPTSSRALAILGRFKRVHVAEDCAYLPWIEAVRKFWAAKGLTGPVQIDCDRSAYRYHGVALAKALCGTAEAPAHVLAAERRGAVFSIQLANGTARITEPRDYATGTLRMTRNGVTISSHPGDGVVPVQILTDAGLCVGFEVGGTRVQLSSAESLLVGKIGHDDSIVSLMSALKRVGLARMFAMMAENKEPWPLTEGLNDSEVDQIRANVA